MSFLFHEWNKNQAQKTNYFFVVIVVRLLGIYSKSMRFVVITSLCLLVMMENIDKLIHVNTIISYFLDYKVKF